jgi:hypothetical protein
MEPTSSTRPFLHSSLVLRLQPNLLEVDDIPGSYGKPRAECRILPYRCPLPFASIPETRIDGVEILTKLLKHHSTDGRRNLVSY